VQYFKHQSSGAGRKHGKDVAQTLSDVFQVRRGTDRERQRTLFFVAFYFFAQLLAGAGNGESFLVKQPLDMQHVFNVFAAIHSLPGTAFNRLQLRKFRLPKAQNVGWKPTEAGYFANPEIQSVRNHNVGSLTNFDGGFAAGAQIISPDDIVATRF
jgi:hypothetical protein